ncbi:MAG: hypothetical protein LQ349_002185 [Xanthoria aureola]|nr:MAG: hypothetical protein LQ349_002185 [Xanthoria aureola]
MFAKIIGLLALSLPLVQGGGASTALIERAGPDLKTLLSEPGRKWCSGTQVFFPGQKNYASLTTQRWTTYEAPSYLAAIKPACVADVQKVVKLCAELDIPFLPTGGGHGYSTSFGKLKNGLSLDLGAFKQVKVDKAAKTATIGGAATFGDVFDPLYAAGFEIPTGSCSCVGFLGGTLGGGVGRYQGIHGLIIDSLLSLNMVTAAGKLITVSATENAELFWGMRGAGFNYGVVVNATYKVHPLTNGGEVQAVDFIFTREQNETFFKRLASFQGTLPPELALLTYVGWNATYGGTVIILDVTYPGSKDKFLQLVKPFTDLKPAYTEVQTLPWNRLLRQVGFQLNDLVCIKEQQHSLYSVGTRNLSSPDYISAFAKYDRLFADYPDTRFSTLELEVFPTQAVVAVPRDSTAYPWRDIQGHVMIQMSFTGSPTSPGAKAANKVAQELRTAFSKTSGYNQLEVYVSYAHGDEDPAAWYGKDKLPRLVELKKKWDPKNIFRFDNPLPSKYP